MSLPIYFPIIWSFGMVIDFGDLKKIVKEEIVDVYDHATVFNKNTPCLAQFSRLPLLKLTSFFKSSCNSL